MSREFITEMRRSLEHLNREIIDHPLILDARSKRLPLDKVKVLLENQAYIVHHDARSLSMMLARTTRSDEADYLARLVQVDLSALEALKNICALLYIDCERWEDLRIVPESVSYAHFLAFLSNFANTGEQIFALLVNLPVWSEACSRLGAALREKYGITETRFFDGFANIPTWVEERGVELIGRYLQTSRQRMRLFGRLIQAYEKSFWDGVYFYRT
ncbi:MAG: TenA family transcriptional regulator [Aigarchaeota archaeon]|nr:TenA family transcriptional regulator [Aigarchaeota archaeon]MDW8093163.1 TenA family transcriptional regulator [Nitrososphaerota archaeon]